MTEKIIQDAGPISPGQAAYLVRVAARAPSVHNTQPWRFRICEHAIELYADGSRQLQDDPVGREMLISCGAALYGLRLAVRSLGRQPEVELFPELHTHGRPGLPAGSRLLARVRLGSVSALNSAERKMLDAVPHRHTHRGPFEPVPLPAGLLACLQDDAAAEGATLAVVEENQCGRQLAAIIATSAGGQDLGPVSRAEIVRWTRGVDSQARDGVPAHAFPATPNPNPNPGSESRPNPNSGSNPGPESRPNSRPNPGSNSGPNPGWWPRRDFDLGRGLGRLTEGDPAAAVTAMLVTVGDGEEDWLRAGQALNRLLLHAAGQWVFACLQTQPLQAAATRALIHGRLALPGPPQLLLQLGVARTTRATGRRPAVDLIAGSDF